MHTYMHTYMHAYMHAHIHAYMQGLYLFFLDFMASEPASRAAHMLWNCTRGLFAMRGCAPSSSMESAIACSAAQGVADAYWVHESLATSTSCVKQDALAMRSHVKPCVFLALLMCTPSTMGAHSHSSSSSSS